VLNKPAASDSSLDPAFESEKGVRNEPKMSQERKLLY